MTRRIINIVFIAALLAVASAVKLKPVPGPVESTFLIETAVKDGLA